MNDVRTWLGECGLDHYADLFSQQALNWDVLPDLTEVDLASLGIPLGDRKRLLKAISLLSHEDLTGGARSADAAPLAARPEPERRYLTVMFCDLVGSTALARQLDPEDLRSVIRTYQDCCAGIVARYDGFICRHIGDGIVIYFGYPRAHEDDAERALHAGLDLIQAIGHLTTETGAPLQARIGVTTGLVIVGDLIGTGPAQEVVALGDPLNIASRLQSLAAPNGLVVDKTTHDLTSGFYSFIDLGEQSLKGLAESVQVWSVTEAVKPQSRFAGTRTARPTPFVNRDHELGTLLSTWGAAAMGTGQLVLVAGDPGIGKSRLVQVFESRLAGQPHGYVLVQSSPYHQSTALYPFVEQVRHAAVLTSHDTPEKKIEKLSAYFTGLASQDEAVSLFATLLSIPEADDGSIPGASSTKESAFKIILEQFSHMADNLPLLVVVEDAQWLDPTSLDLLEALANHLRDRRALLLVTYRSDFPLSFAERIPSTLLQLERLQRGDCRTVVEHVADKALPRVLLDEILDRADGVALFAEELTKAAVESDAVIDHGDRFELRFARPELALPATLNGSLMARLDRNPEAREIAQIGSVIGREFTFDMLVRVAGRPEAEVRKGLTRLIETDLLLQIGAARHAVYRFKHALVQDAAYESLLLSRRRALHARVAEDLENHHQERVTAEPALLAHHFKRAGLFEKAIAYFLEAGRLAIGRSAMAEAISALKAGIELVPRLPASGDAGKWELELQVLLGHALRAARAPSAPETGQAWDRAYKLCLKEGDDTHLQQVLYGQFLFHQGNANLKQARALGEDLLALAGKYNDDSAFIRGHSAVGRTAFGQGDFAAARHHLEQALSDPKHGPHLVSTSIRGPESRVLNLCYLAWTLFIQGRCAEGLSRCVESIEVAGQLAQPYDIVVAHGNACYTHQFRRDMHAVATNAGIVMSLAEEQGFAAWLSLGRIFQGWFLTQIGDLDAGLPMIEQALAEHRATGERLEVPYFFGLLAECYGKAGRPKDGLRMIGEAMDMARTTGEAWFDAELLRLQGELHLSASPGGIAEAVAYFESALTLARMQGSRLWELRATLSLARHRQELDADRARELLEPLFASFEGDLLEREHARDVIR
jgi:class 3 adenylate cyclase/predicted ATPase